MKQKIALLFISALALSLVACGGGAPAAGDASALADDGNQPAAETGSEDNLPAGTLEVTLPHGETVQMPIPACGGNDTMLDIQEFTTTAPGSTPYVIGYKLSV